MGAKFPAANRGNMAEFGKGENTVRCHIESILGAEPEGNYSYVMCAVA